MLKELKILQSNSFTTQLKKLCKAKHKTIYGSVGQEINDFFKTCNKLDLVWQQNEFLDGNDKVRLSKIRLPNRQLASGKSGGYRIVVLCNKTNNTVTLLYIFPKVGPERQDNISNAFKFDLVKEYKTQSAANSLIVSEFNV